MNRLTRILLIILLGFWGALILDHMAACAQDPNPQSGFAPTVLLASPSLYLNFNDTTTGFKDQISGSSFTEPANVTYTYSPGLPTVPTTTSVGWWPLNEGTGSTAIDNTATADSGTWHGNSSCSSSHYYSDSTYSAVGCFDGSTDYIAMPYNSALEPATTLTVGAWIYPTNTLSSAGWENIIVMPNRTSGVTAPYDDYILHMNNGFPMVGVNVSGVDNGCLSPVAVTANQWNFVVGTYDGLTKKIYINGTLENTCSQSGSIDYTEGNTGITIGALTQYSPTQYFVGRISSPFVLSNALTQAQIAAISPPFIQSTPSYSYSGTVTPRQPGFDNTLLTNTSAEFPWNGWNAAPNNTLGAIEWSSPWSMMVQVDRLNWSRTGTLVLASKGDVSGATNYWELYLQMTANVAPSANGQVSQLCFKRYSAGITNGTCTPAVMDVMPNGFNYNIIVEDAGTGGPTENSSIPNPLTIYINGLTTSDMGAGAEISIASSYVVGFGSVILSASGGTGYANTTNFTSTGGGANCIVTGTMTASGGVPTGIGSPNGYTNLGCTSVPTIVLTSPTGTGVTITATLSGASMNSTAFPLMIPGYVSSGVYYGVAGATSTQTPTYIDEFAIFPFNLNKTQIHSLFYWTKFYQGLVYPHSTAGSGAPLAIFDLNSCGGDPSGGFALVMTLEEHLHGVFNLAGMVDDVENDGSSYTTAPSLAWYRQMLDVAGLSNVPVSVGLGAPNTDSSSCVSLSQLATYNASTPLTLSSYESSTTMLRQIYAANPTLPIIYLAESPLNVYAAFLQSPADSISPLTGLQLQAQNAANGGFLSVEGGVCPPPAWGACTLSIAGSGETASNNMNVPAAAQYIFANNGALPIYFESGNPQPSGPGARYTRTAKDPFYLWSQAVYSDGDNPLGTETRPGWNTMQTAEFVSPYFTGGLSGIVISGGTGYANLTPFTSIGGGIYCNVQGIMTASGGVPNGIEYTWGVPFTNPTGAAYSGTESVVSGGVIGYGCTSVPTLVLTNPTGTAVTLTGVLSHYCGTYSASETAGVWSETYTNTSCSNHWMDTDSAYATLGNPPIFQWFQNSLIDPPPNGRPLR